MAVRTQRPAAVFGVHVLLLGAIVVLAARNSGRDAPPAAAAGGVTRVRLGQADPAHAPGQTLYLEQVTIAPGSRLAEHFHQGTQVARVVSGVLTYNIVSGTAILTRRTAGPRRRRAPGTCGWPPARRSPRPGGSSISAPTTAPCRW